VDQSANVSAQASPAALVTFAGDGRNRLCLNEQAGRAGFVTYGERRANCTASGALQRTGNAATLVPDGDQSCRVELQIVGDVVTLGPSTTSCAYYCGPSASYSGARFQRVQPPEPATDLAGDPLC
jgi:hypothetical protein